MQQMFAKLRLTAKVMYEGCVYNKERASALVVTAKSMPNIRHSIRMNLIQYSESRETSFVRHVVQCTRCFSHI